MEHLNGQELPTLSPLRDQDRAVGELTLRESAAERSTDEADEIETDRDSFTPATTTAGVRRLIVESAYSFIDNRRSPETHSYPEFVMRYGVTERIELRLGWNYEVGGGGSVSGIDAGESDEFAGLEREGEIAYGMKMALTEQSGYLPKSAVILHGFTPTSGPDPATQFVGTYVFGWRLPRGWTWDQAIRYSLDASRGDHFNLWAPSSVLKIPLNDRWKVHAEYFGVFSEGKAENSRQHFFSPGAHYLITPDFEVGLRVGWGLSEQSPNFFSNIGLGYRF